MKRSIAAALLAATVLAAGPAGAQDYPTQPVTLVIPFAAGGPTDVIGRMMAETMSRDLGQQVIVENVTGAGGTLASRHLAQANPDGYTVLLHHMGITTSATLYRDLPYDPLTAFDYIGQVTTVPMLLLARPDHPADDLAGVLELIREDPEGTMLANAGPGAVSHLCGMLFQQLIDAQLTTIPYQGTGPALTDLMGGQVDLLCDQTTGATNAVQQGSVKPIATATTERIDVLPDVPTAAEEGLEGFEVGVWHGLYVPAGTPEPVKERLTQSLQATLQDERVIARFADLGTAPVALEDATPESLEAHFRSELEFWRPIIEEAGEYAD